MSTSIAGERKPLQQMYCQKTNSMCAFIAIIFLRWSFWFSVSTMLGWVHGIRKVFYFVEKILICTYKIFFFLIPNIFSLFLYAQTSHVAQIWPQKMHISVIISFFLTLESVHFVIICAFWPRFKPKYNTRKWMHFPQNRNKSFQDL